MANSAPIETDNPAVAGHGVASQDVNGLDAGSLERLHDIIIPEPVSFWPASPGWLLLLLLLLSFLLPWFIWRVRQYRANRYRRSALSELQAIRRVDDTGQKLKQSLILLKRTALSVYPRQQIASLSSEKWWQFLTQNSGVEFSASTRELCTELLYNPALTNDMSYEMDDKTCQLFFQEIKAWIQQHHFVNLQGANFPGSGEDDV